MVSFSVVVCLSLLALAGATNVRQCRGKSFQNLSENVQLTGCQKPPCLLKKGTSQHISVAFVPGEDITDLTNHVTANVFGLDVPYIGVDGQSICNKIYNENDEKTPCPLKAGNKYIYVDDFGVLKEYPTLNTKVQWALVGDGKEVSCFVVAASIA